MDEPFTVLLAALTLPAFVLLALLMALAPALLQLVLRLAAWRGEGYVRRSLPERAQARPVWKLRERAAPGTPPDAARPRPLMG